LTGSILSYASSWYGSALLDKWGFVQMSDRDSATCPSKPLLHVPESKDDLG
jgi:hypothetical protein